MFDYTLHPKRRLRRNPINTTSMSQTAAMLSSFCYNNESKAPNSRYNKHHSNLAIPSPLTGYIYLRFTVNCGFTMPHWQPFIALSAQKCKNIKNASQCHTLSTSLYLLKCFPFFIWSPVEVIQTLCPKWSGFAFNLKLFLPLQLAQSSCLHYFWMRSDKMLSGCPKAS